MTNVGMQKNSYNDLNFSFKTSSGDNISLSMFDKKELQTHSFKSKNLKIEEFSLKHSFGYSFSYKGNGIDENDKKEIAFAMKKLQPKIDEFLKNVKEDKIPTPKEILNKAFDLKTELPKPKDENHKNAMKSSLLELFDKSLQAYFPDKIVLENAKKLFEALSKQLQSFNLYA